MTEREIKALPSKCYNLAVKLYETIAETSLFKDVLGGYDDSHLSETVYEYTNTGLQFILVSIMHKNYCTFGIGGFSLEERIDYKVNTYLASSLALCKTVESLPYTEKDLPFSMTIANTVASRKQISTIIFMSGIENSKSPSVDR